MLSVHVRPSPLAARQSPTLIRPPLFNCHRSHCLGRFLLVAAYPYRCCSPSCAPCLPLIALCSAATARFSSFAASSSSPGSRCSRPHVASRCLLAPPCCSPLAARRPLLAGCLSLLAACIRPVVARLSSIVSCRCLLLVARWPPFARHRSPLPARPSTPKSSHPVNRVGDFDHVVFRTRKLSAVIGRSTAFSKIRRWFLQSPSCSQRRLYTLLNSTWL